MIIEIWKVGSSSSNNRDCYGNWTNVIQIVLIKMLWWVHLTHQSNVSQTRNYNDFKEIIWLSFGWLEFDFSLSHMIHVMKMIHESSSRSYFSRGKHSPIKFYTYLYSKFRCTIRIPLQTWPWEKREITEEGTFYDSKIPRDLRKIRLIFLIKFAHFLHIIPIQIKKLCEIIIIPGQNQQHLKLSSTGVLDVGLVLLLESNGFGAS